MKNNSRSLTRPSVTAATMGVALLAATGRAYAAEAAPWDTPLDTIVSWLTGPTAGLVIIIAAALALYGLMFAEGGSVWRRLGYVGFAAACLGVVANIVEDIFVTDGALMVALL